MLAQLKLEAIGLNTRQYMRLWTAVCNDIAEGMGTAIIGKPPARWWCAEITGTHPKYKLERCFLKAKTDYSKTNSKGSRGVYLYFLLESGKLYETLMPLSWKSSDRFFCQVTDTGDIVKLTKYEAMKWLKANTQ